MLTPENVQWKTSWISASLNSVWRTLQMFPVSVMMTGSMEWCIPFHSTYCIALSMTEMWLNPVLWSFIFSFHWIQMSGVFLAHDHANISHEEAQAPGHSMLAPVLFPHDVMGRGAANNNDFTSSIYSQHLENLYFYAYIAIFWIFLRWPFFLMLLIKCSYFNALPYALYYGVMVELLLKTHCSMQALNCTARSFVSPSWTVFGLAHVPVPNSSTFDLTKSVLCRREKVEKNVAGMSGWNLLILELIFISMDFVWAVA